jgi:hypothetical protein
MPDPEKITAVVSEWVAKAENDVKNAALVLRAMLPTSCTSLEMGKPSADRTRSITCASIPRDCKSKCAL